jgi:phosphoenolpyruvate carboxykinase (GTP)
MAAIDRNTIFTNVAMTASREPWWEGMTPQAPPDLLDWQGRKVSADAKGPAAHPNSRFTVPAQQAPRISPHWEDPAGVPISAIIFGGRRSRVAPLVYESLNWQHGVFVGAGMASETTAAITGQVGVRRRDPMAMLPFCGYHMGDYFGHWLEMGKGIAHPPKIFHVNWFRKGSDGKYLWPGYGENVRVLKWILERVNGKGQAEETPIGFVPTTHALTLDGLDISAENMKELLRVDAGDWQKEAEEIGTFFNKFGDRLPPELRAEQAHLTERLNLVASAKG